MDETAFFDVDSTVLQEDEYLDRSENEDDDDDKIMCQLRQEIKKAMIEEAKKTSVTVGTGSVKAASKSMKVETVVPEESTVLKEKNVSPTLVSFCLSLNSFLSRVHSIAFVSAVLIYIEPTLSSHPPPPPPPSISSERNGKC